jgi:hypothetical protein
MKMAEKFDQELFRCLKAGLEALTEAEKRTLELICATPTYRQFACRRRSAKNLAGRFG